MRRIALLGLGLAALQAGAADFAGRWSGMAAIPGRELPVVVDLARDASGAWAGSLIIPGIDVKGAALHDIQVVGDEVRFDAGHKRDAFYRTGTCAATSPSGTGA